MNNKYHRQTGILLLLLSLGVYQAAFAAKRVSVTSAYPAAAPQEQVLDVTIGGSGFDNTVSEVNFLVPCDSDPCDPDETGGVTTGNIRVRSSKEIVVEVTISGDATPVLRDVQVKMSRGRGGKGTTLFKVQDTSEQFSPVEINVGYDGGAFENASPWEGPYSQQSHPWTDETSGFYFDNWDANTLEQTPRPCSYTSAGANSGGRYDCFESNSEAWPHGGRISIDLSGLSWVEASPPRKGWKNPELCDLLNTPAVFSKDEILRFGVTRYSIFFLDGCDANACSIRIGANSYSGASSGRIDPQLVQLHPFHDLAGYPDIGVLSVSGWAPDDLTVIDLNEVTTTGELNVFSVEQAIPIDRFTINFSSLKNGSIVATCESPVGVDEVWFVTTPQ
jgi:hypothetical protein